MSQQPMTDIQTRDDIDRMVRAFYTRMFADPVMGSIFIDIVQMDLESHMPIMCDFWELQLFQKPGYRGGMMAVHLRVHMMAHLERHHFMRWLDFWEATVDEYHTGPIANHAKMVASRVAGNLSFRIEEFEGFQEAAMTSPLPFTPGSHG